MREALQEVQSNVPLSSVGSVLLAAGDFVPERLGRNCVGQSRALANDLRGKGYEANYISLAPDSGLHYAVVVRDGDLYFLDPSSIHSEPINLTTLFRDRQRQIVGSFPIVKGIASTLCAEPISNNRFNLSKHVFDGCCTSMRFQYRFDMNTVSSMMPRDDDPYIATANGRKIVLRTLDSDGTVRFVRHRFDTGVRDVKTVGASGETVATSSEGHFMGAVEDIADRIAMGVHELVAYIDRAARDFDYVKSLTF